MKTLKDGKLDIGFIRFYFKPNFLRDWNIKIVSDGTKMSKTDNITLCLVCHCVYDSKKTYRISNKIVERSWVGENWENFTYFWRKDKGIRNNNMRALCLYSSRSIIIIWSFCLSFVSPTINLPLLGYLGSWNVVCSLISTQLRNLMKKIGVTCLPSFHSSLNRVKTNNSS